MATIVVLALANAPLATADTLVRVQTKGAPPLPQIGRDRQTEPVTFAAPIDACPPERIMMNNVVTGADGNEGRLAVCLRPEAGALEQRFQNYLGRFRAAGFTADGLVRQSKDAILSANRADMRIDLFMSQTKPEEPMIEIIHQQFAPKPAR